MYSSMTPRRRSASSGVWVRTFIPSATGVVHDAGEPLRPSMSTRHMRHEPKGSRLSVAHSFGMSMPHSVAARITEVPSGTSTCLPSISTDTVASPERAGVP